MIKKIVCFTFALLLAATLAFGQDIELKQGMVYTLDSKEIENLTTVELASTKPIDGLGNWNMLLDGWSLDIGLAYDANELSDAALLIGREFGTLGKYLPIDFPFKDKIKITLYPIGLYFNNVFEEPELESCIGGALFELKITF